MDRGHYADSSTYKQSKWSNDLYMGSVQFYLNLNAHLTYKQTFKVFKFSWHVVWRSTPRQAQQLNEQTLRYTSIYKWASRRRSARRCQNNTVLFWWWPPCHFMLCIQSVHLTSHFKYSGAKGMTHYVCSPMLRYCADYIRSECAIICYYFPCMNRELFIRARTNTLLQRICCCSANDALHAKSMWPIMCTWIWSDRTFEWGHFIIL